MKIKGKVKKGNQKASEMGFPTANISLEDIKLAPGIYAGRVFFDNENYKGALYVGKINPQVLEVHVIDFNGDLYDKEIEVVVYDKIRDDFNLDDKEKLKEMISNDVEMIRLELDKNL